MSLGKKLFKAPPAEAAAGSGNTQDGLILHLDAADVDSYDNNGSTWYNIADFEYAPAENPEEHFNTVLYTGTSSTNSITGVGFAPDFVWIKGRNYADHHGLFDTVRGDHMMIAPSANTDTTTNNTTLTSFDDDGFTLGTDASDRVNDATKTYVAWCLKAGGAPTASTPFMIDGTGYATASAAGMGDDGDLTLEKASVNTKLGFAIYKFDPDLVSGETNTFQHGLGAAPELIITKSVSNVYNWWTWTKQVDGSWDYLRLNDTHAKTNDTYTSGGIATADDINFSYTFAGVSSDHIMYAFSSVRGISKVGRYAGTGSAGNKVYTGFEPAFVMFKNTSAVGSWIIHDNKRDTDNPRVPHLRANTTGAEDSGSNEQVDFNRDGFTLKSGGQNANYSGHTYIYLAFAKNTNDESLITARDDFEEGTVTSGFEMELKANDYSGSGNWLDSTSNDHDVTFSGTPTYVNDGNSDYFEFDGSSDYGTIPHSTDLNISTSFTVEAWVNRDDNGEGYIAVKQGGSGAYGYYMQFHNNTAQGYSLAAYNTSNSRYTAHATIAKSGTAGEWQHVVGTCDGSNVKIYVDGDLKGTTAFSGTPAANTVETVIGAYASPYSGKWDGKIAQVRVYQTALSSSQIKTNYDATKGFYQYPNLVFDLDLSTSTPSDVTVVGATYDEALGNMFTFDGVNDELRLTKDYTLNDRTIEFWIRPYDLATQWWVFDALPDRGYGSDSYGAWSIYMNASSIVFVGDYYDGNSYGGYYGSHGISNFEWVHVAFSCGGNSYAGYVNGELISEISSSSYDKSQSVRAVNINDVRFMSHRENRTGDYYAEGAMGSIRIYDSILTQDQIRQNYNATKHDYSNNKLHFTNAGSRANWLSEGSWNFDASANEYFTHTAGAFQGKTGYNPFAISAWVKPDEVTSSWRVIVGSRGYSDGSNNGWQLYANQDDIKFWGNNGTGYELVTLNSVLSAGTWVHVLIQRTNDAWEGYINGSLSTNSSSNSTKHLTDDLGNVNSVDSDLIIGRNWQTNAYQWDGTISDIKIFNKALTAAEITAEYDKGKFGDK